jgi:hypothetical protein
MRFVHSLVRIKNGAKAGWCTPVELGEAAPHYISFVIPVDDGADDSYACEVVRIDGDEREVVVYKLVKEGRDSFLLRVDKAELWFTVRPVSQKERRLPYVGKLKHADFASLFTEIEPEEPSALDRLYEDEGVLVVGCDPVTHYLGRTKSSTR